LEETVSTLITKDEALAVVVFLLINAVLVQNYDYVHYNFLRDTAEISSSEFDFLMALQPIGIAIGTLIYAAWLWSIEPYKLVMFGMLIKNNIAVMAYLNLQRWNEDKISDFAFNVPRYLFDSSSSVCLILLPITMHLAKKRTGAIHTLSIFCSLLYAVTEWLSMLVGALCSLAERMDDENLIEKYKHLLVITSPGRLIGAILVFTLVKRVQS
jgi:hypothetical protein